MIWRWVWRGVVLFVGRKVWAAWLRRHQQRTAGHADGAAPALTRHGAGLTGWAA